MKKCSVCKEEKPLEGFYNSKASKDGKDYRCILCGKLAVKGYRRGPRKEGYRLNTRVSRRRHVYGLEPEDFETLYQNQRGACAICEVELCDNFGKHHKPNKLVIDHDHNNGKVRGLLCTMCNKGIGLLKDSPDLLERALTYLKQNTNTH